MNPSAGGAVAVTQTAESAESFPVGTWLSLVEHSLGVRGVGSSNLPVPTIKTKGLTRNVLRVRILRRVLSQLKRFRWKVALSELSEKCQCREIVCLRCLNFIWEHTQKNCSAVDFDRRLKLAISLVPTNTLVLAGIAVPPLHTVRVVLAIYAFAQVSAAVVQTVTIAMVNFHLWIGDTENLSVQVKRLAATMGSMRLAHGIHFISASVNECSPLERLYRLIVGIIHESNITLSQRDSFHSWINSCSDSPLTGRFIGGRALRAQSNLPCTASAVIVIALPL
jgi:hypothetical protein